MIVSQEPGAGEADRRAVRELEPVTASELETESRDEGCDPGRERRDRHGTPAGREGRDD